MGVKRPLEEKNFPELSFKQPKQIDHDIKLTFTTDDLSSHRTSRTVDSPGETKSNCCESNDEVMPENSDVNDASRAHKELEVSAPLALATELKASAPLFFATELEANACIPLATELEASASLPLATELETSVRLPFITELEANTPLPLVTSSSSDEDSGDEDSSFMYNLPGYVDLCIPWRQSEIYQDSYAVLLNGSPRKEVAIGPEHQAEVPQWDPSSSGKDISEKAVDSDWEQKMMGTTVIPIPTSFGSSIGGGAVGCGRIECSCPDAGSMRCVQQHVMEAREKLRETIGEAAFTKLGFYDMGEEVAGKWTAQDELLFHEVVLSNPASLGSDFWAHLSSTFPNRSKSELISYYFNVFMLRRRAVQNRSYLLQIDSDDDEDHSAAHGDASMDDEETDEENVLKLNREDFNIGGEEDDDSAVELFDDDILDEGWVNNYHSEPVNLPNFYGEDGTSGTPDTSNGNGSADKEEAAGEEPTK